jgi:radical SAM superfamily enzyme YgiQ (UPF0313 family)
MGGMHATLVPDEVALHADSVYIGDAELKWHEVLKDVRQRRLKPVYAAPVGAPQPGIQPRREIFKEKGYLPLTLMQFGRGCRYQCEFCAVSVYFDKKQYYRDIGELLAEIDAQDRKHIFFVDDNLISNIEAVKLLFKELISLKIRWVSQATIDMTLDPELMKLMVDSGCIGNVIGFESISRSNLRSMKKAPNLVGDYHDYEHQLEILRDYGLQTWAAFALGHDDDTKETIKQTMEFAMKNKFIFSAFNILMPYPNTPLYHRLQAEGRLLFDGRWWLHPEYQFNHAAFIPAKMTPDELTEAYFNARAKYNSIRSIMYRAFDFKTNMRSFFNLAVYLSYTPLFRKETFKKQDMLFGYN